MAINKYQTNIPVDFTDKELRDYLTRLYWQEQKSTKEIANETGIAHTTLWILFVKYKIRTRTISESIKVHWNKRRMRLG